MKIEENNDGSLDRQKSPSTNKAQEDRILEGFTHHRSNEYMVKREKKALRRYH